MSSAEATGHAFERVDPSTLLVDTNIRAVAELDKSFLGSIRDQGVLVPIVAVRCDDGLRVRLGHRRTLAAIEAKLADVPVVIVEADASDDVERIVAQWSENEHRVGLTTGEKVAAVEQLSAFGLSATAIARRIKTPKADVQHALDAAGSDVAKSASERYGFLSLDQAATVAEFDQDDQTVKALVVAASRSAGEFDHVAERARSDRARREQADALKETLQAAGTVVIDPPDNDDQVVRPLQQLVAKPGGQTQVTPERHAKCAGHAAYVRTGWWDPEPVYVCVDWAAHGHGLLHDNLSRSGPMSEGQKAERRTTVENNRAWRAAETVRRRYLAVIAKRRTPPKGSAPYVASALLTGGHELRRAMEAPLMLRESLTTADRPADLAGGVNDGRATVLALAVVLCAQEQATGLHSWRLMSATTKGYLEFLEATGYELSAVEQLAAGRTTQ